MGFNHGVLDDLNTLYHKGGSDLRLCGSLAELYGPRKCEYLGVWERGDGWRMKGYGIPFQRPHVREPLIKAARNKMTEVLPPAETVGTPGIGCVVVHDSEDYCYVLIQWWANNIEMYQRIFYSEIAKPTLLKDVSTDTFGCLYELEVIDFERRLYTRLLREGGGTVDLERYVNTHFSGDI